MIGEKVKSLLISKTENLIKPADEVAVVGIENPLDHALLLLTADQYSVVPVLDNESKIRGLISMPRIMQSITDIEAVHFEKLNEIKVGEVMIAEYPVVKEDFELEDVLHMLINHAFLSVIDHEGTFKGIITRSEVLKGTNRLAHEFEKVYDVTEKKEVTIK